MKKQKLFYKYGCYDNNEYRHPYIEVWTESYDHGLPKSCDKELFTIEAQTDRKHTSPYGFHASMPISWSDSKLAVKVLNSFLHSLNGNFVRDAITWLHKNHVTRITYDRDSMEHIPYSARKYPELYFKAKEKGLTLSK